MNSLVYRENKFIYTGAGGEKTLLDCRDYLSNKSRVSLHRLPGQDFLTVPELLVGLIQQEQRGGTGLEFPFGLIDTLIAARLVRTSQPVRVLEYGCADGKLSGHLAKILGAFHEESVLVCAYDTMDELWMQWMERIAALEKLPKISYLAGDYGCLHLQKDYFDIVLINGGMVHFTDPQSVIADALSLAAEGGMILCYADDSPLLESVFKLYFETREEYEISPVSRVLAAG